MASRGGIDNALYLMEEAFRGVGIEESIESQALLSNLASVAPERWRALPAGASRSIGDIANHVGACKIMYDDYAFGAGTLRFGTTEVEPFASAGSPEEVVAWLETAHDRLVGHVRGLADDTELETPRLTNWGRATPDTLDRLGDDHPRRLPRR